MPSTSPAPAVPGKRIASGGESRLPEGVIRNKALELPVSPVSPVGGYRLEGSVNGLAVSLLVDTGAAVTLLRKDVWDRVSVSEGPLTPCSALGLVGADGSPLQTFGTTSVTLALNGATMSVDVVVASPLTSEGILGLDFLKKQKVLIDLESERIFLREQDLSIPLCTPTAATRSRRIGVRAISNLEVPARTEVEVTMRLDAAVESGTWLLEDSRTNPAQKGMMVACAIIQPRSPTIPVRLVNVSSEPITIYAQKRIAYAEEVGDVICSVGASQPKQTTASTISEQKQQILWELVEGTDAELDPDQKEIFYQLLVSYADVVAESSTDLGQTDWLQHTIDTGDAPPIRQSVRRLPPQRRSEVQQLLQSMLQNGVVEPSRSPWASPIVLVKKKDGSTRFCVDYRKVNGITRKDAYPLPRIDTTLDTLSGSQWFSTLDLISGYWQVHIEESDRPKTAFCTTEGLFQFRVMPFGLCNAPATFQRLMDLVLSGLQWEHCLVYLDDVIILGRTFKEHIQNIQLVLQRLREAGLKVKPSKCVFFRREVRYLGHIVSREGVSPDPSKTEKVASWPTPRSVKEVQQFLGFSSYYRRFVEDYATLAKPLHRLTERSSKFLWTPECQRSFDELRCRLVSPPILAHPDFSLPFTLDTDASDIGIGGVLSQVGADGKERVIAYGSRLLTKAERQYCTTRKELLAVVMFTKQYRPYLAGQQFILRTDHSSLSWLHNFRDPQGQLARWLEQLQEFNFTVVHRRGRKHTNADALSRLPCRQCGRNSHLEVDELVIGATSLQGPLFQAELLREAQLKDAMLAPLLRWPQAMCRRLGANKPWNKAPSANLGPTNDQRWSAVSVIPSS